MVPTSSLIQLVADVYVHWIAVLATFWPSPRMISANADARLLLVLMDSILIHSLVHVYVPGLVFLILDWIQRPVPVHAIWALRLAQRTSFQTKRRAAASVPFPKHSVQVAPFLMLLNVNVFPRFQSFPFLQVQAVPAATTALAQLLPRPIPRRLSVLVLLDLCLIHRAVTVFSVLLRSSSPSP